MGRQIMELNFANATNDNVTAAETSKAGGLS